MFAPPLCCPLDQLPLTLLQTGAVCAAGHRFDRSREGYWPLLPVHFKRSRDPGDSKEMVQARRAFLDAGHYRPIADWVAFQASGALAAHSCPVVVDAGCGEGYYLHHLQQSLGVPAEGCIGFDISKWAVRDAARRYRHIHWAVGTNRAPPVLSGQVDLLLCLFGFESYPAFHSLLAPGGSLLLVEAAPHHLLSLRRKIYPEVQIKPMSCARRAQDAGLSVAARDRLQYHITLDQQALQQLLLMTPHLFRATASGKQEVEALASLEVEVDVVAHRLVRP